MLRRIVRWLLLLVLAASVASTVLTAVKIASDPLAAPYEPATTDEILSNTRTMLAELGQPDDIVSHLHRALNEYPRNWLGLSALLAHAQATAIPLPPDLSDALAIAKEDDFGLYAFPTSCADCSSDPGRCMFAQTVICQTPLSLPPLPNLDAIAAAEAASASGESKDQATLAWDITALRADTLAALTAQDAENIRTGARLAQLGNRMQRTSVNLTNLASDAALDGVDWAAMTRLQSASELETATRAEAFAALATIAAAIGQLDTASSVQTTLHLLPLIDSAADARGLATAAGALGPQLIVTADLLGKPNLIRSTLRLSKTGWTLVAGLAAMWLSLALLIGGWLKRRRKLRAAEVENDDAV
jgi:hypothetical protein